ncbi:unnamed protein product [Jaminaea pallidilutea]
MSQTWPVELYVYDLSHGLASQLSMGLLGRHFPGVWHTSIVVHSKEFFFGQGISITQPGGSHHGQPVETINLGNTEIDGETWLALVDDLRQRFTPQAYNLMSFNCNTFSNECANILVGKDIPAHILSLPSDFQSALGSGIGAASGNSSLNTPGPPSQLGPSGQYAQRTQSGPYGSNVPAPSGDSGSPSGSQGKAADLYNVTTAQQLDGLLKDWPCSIVLFTNTQTCPPCKVIHPVFESLASEYAPKSPSDRQIAFVVVDSSPASMSLMSSHGIRGTPTFKCFVGAAQRHQFSGADANELRTQVDLTLFEIWRAHPHSQIGSPLQGLRKIPAEALTSPAVPNWASAMRILDEAISAVRVSDFKVKADLQESRKIVAKQVVPWLESGTGGRQRSALSSQAVQEWSKASGLLVTTLPPAAWFPLVDMLRLAVLDQSALQILAEHGLVKSMLDKASEALRKSTSEATAPPSLRATRLTTLRLLTNVTASVSESPRTAALGSSETPTNLVVGGLLHPDKTVRNAAASVAFNLCRWRRATYSQWVRRDGTSQSSGSSSFFAEDFDTELLSALLESIKEEKEMAETIHRLSAALLSLLYLCPDVESIHSLCEVLGAKETLQHSAQSDLVKTSEKAAEIRQLLLDCARLTQVAPAAS